jgi:regulator of protease activity HflC (stomatin/prohibitin superfamily)
MIGDFLGKLLELIEYIWPIRRVWQWESGGYYIAGRFWKRVGPGLHFVVPWFMDVRAISTVKAIVTTPRLDITLRDGSVLTFAAAATCQVIDIDLAVNTVENYTETTQELLAAVLADKLASVDVARMEPENRGRLMSSLSKWVQEEAATFGVEVTKVRFVSFVLRPRTFRLLQDQAAMSSW